MGKKDYWKNQTLQTIAQDLHAILWTHFRQRESSLFYMYIDPYEVGRVNLPTSEEIEADIPNSNGWSTPLENMQYTSSQYLDTLVCRYAVTERSEHAKQARAIFEGLRHLRMISESLGYVPRGVLPDLKTHYKDVSIDHMSFWVLGMWTWFQGPLATSEDRRWIRREIGALASDVEHRGWRFCREDGRLSPWGDLTVIGSPVHRAPLVLLMLLAVTAYITGDEHWWRLYVRIRDEANSKRLKYATEGPITSEVTGVSSQSCWCLRVLYEIEPDESIRKRYRSAMVPMLDAAISQMQAYRYYETPRGWTDHKFRNKSYRNPMLGLHMVALCPDAEKVAEVLPHAEVVVRHFDHRQEAKWVDHIDEVPRLYWRLVRRGLVTYDPGLEESGDSTIKAIPKKHDYPLHSKPWFEARTRIYHGLPSRREAPQTQHYYVQTDTEKVARWPPSSMGI